MKPTTKAWAIVKDGRFTGNAVPEIERSLMPAIYWTRKAARYFRCLNNGEQVKRVRITVM